MDHDPAQQQRRRATFDRAASAYDARPGYPAAVFERLTADCGVGPGCQVVEIGPGTGQATRPLLDLGCEVTAVELGPAMAARLAERTAGRSIEIITSSFEDVALPDASFDLVLSATAFHWVDPAVGIPKAHALLRPGGWLVLLWNLFGDLDRPDPFHEALHELLLEIEPDIADPQIPGWNVPDWGAWVGEVDDRHLFEPARGETIRWTGTHTTAELVALFATFSSWISRGPERLAELLDALATLADTRFAGHVTRPYQTIVVTARKP